MEVFLAGRQESRVVSTERILGSVTRRVKNKYFA